MPERTFQGAQQHVAVIHDGHRYEFTRGVPVDVPADLAKTLDARFVAPKKKTAPPEPAPTDPAPADTPEEK